MSRSNLRRLGHDEVDVLRLARPKGKECRQLDSCIFILDMSTFFMNVSGTWDIHGVRLTQMRGVEGEAVVYHREPSATKQVS